MGVFCFLAFGIEFLKLAILTNILKKPGEKKPRFSRISNAL
jgi:hypothetical protein